MGIKRIFGDSEGTTFVFVDDHNQGHIYIPVSKILYQNKYLLILFTDQRRGFGYSGIPEKLFWSPMGLCAPECVYCV